MPPDGPTPQLDLETIASRLKPLGSVVRLGLLRFLVRPHYLEEIASHLKMNRYAAKRHVDDLVAIGFVRSVQGERETGPVRDYVIAPEAFFELYDAVRVLGELRPAPEAFAQTMPGLLTRTKPAGTPRRDPHAATPHPYLVAVYGAEVGRAFPLIPNRESTAAWTFGRDSKAHIPLELDPFVSNRHARITRNRLEFVLTDTFSTNGTWLNWQRLPEGESVPLRHGDIVGVGKTLLVFRVDS